MSRSPTPGNIITGVLGQQRRRQQQHRRRVLRRRAPVPAPRAPRPPAPLRPVVAARPPCYRRRSGARRGRNERAGAHVAWRGPWRPRWPSRALEPPERRWSRPAQARLVDSCTGICTTSETALVLSALAVLTTTMSAPRPLSLNSLFSSPSRMGSRRPRTRPQSPSRAAARYCPRLGSADPHPPHPPPPPPPPPRFRSLRRPAGRVARRTRRPCRARCPAAPRRCAARS